MRILLLLLPLLAWSTVIAGQARAELDRFLSGLRTLQADFVQQVVDTSTNEVTNARGTLYLWRPGRFRWQYKNDDGRYILADGHTIWLVEPDLEQVSQRSQKAALKGTPAGLLIGGHPLERDFTIEELGKRDGISWIKLTPKDDNSQVQQVLVAMEKGNLTRLEMADHLGQVTSFRFSHIQRNIPLPEKLFRFQPPPGYDILDQ